MVKKLSISMPEHIFDMYLKDMPHNNLSQYIQKLIMLGAEVELNKKDHYKSQLLASNMKVQQLTSDINKLKAEVGRLKVSSKPRFFGNTPKRILIRP